LTIPKGMEGSIGKEQNEGRKKRKGQKVPRAAALFWGATSPGQKTTAARLGDKSRGTGNVTKKKNS